MISQLMPINSKTQPLSGLNTDLIMVRRIQAKLNGRILDAAPVGDGQFWSPLAVGPYLTPVQRGGG
jgi:hypothetical protein